MSVVEHKGKTVKVDKGSLKFEVAVMAQIYNMLEQ